MESAFLTPSPSFAFGSRNVILNARRQPLNRARTPARGARMTIPVTSTDIPVIERDVWQPGASFLDINDGLTLVQRLERLQNTGLVPPSAVSTLLSWKSSYTKAAADCAPIGPVNADVFSERAFSTLLELLLRHMKTPIVFEPYHRGLPEYYSFGLDFALALVNIPQSRVIGAEHLRNAVKYLRDGHNVIFFSNHQSEADPYAIDALFTSVAGLPREFARQLIFMAGDRVREDPVVVPFSAGRDLLTVYSKKHLDDVPTLRASKVAHNRRTIYVTQKLLARGGRAIWFAPSGGRDRRSTETGRVEVSKFDPDAIEMMRFTAKKSGKPCHFVPMSLVTYDMLPPPSSVGGATLGEERVVNHIGISMAVGEEIDFRNVTFPENADKVQKRDLARRYIQDIVNKGYADIGGYDF